MRFRIQRSFSRRGFDIWLMQDDRQNNRVKIVKPIKFEFTEIRESDLLPEPSLFIDEFMANDLLPQIRSELAGLHFMDDANDLDMAKRIERHMQNHIDSLKLVIEKTLCK